MLGFAIRSPFFAGFTASQNAHFRRLILQKNERRHLNLQTGTPKFNRPPEIHYGIKLIGGNLGYAEQIYSFPHFCACLLNHFLPDYEPYDLIVGYRADDSYFAFANAFLNNTISLEQLRKAMKLGNLGEQVVLKSERAFAQLHFIESIPVDSSQYYPKRMARDRQAREDFQNQKSMATASDAIYMIDILRQNWSNDDPRL